MKKESDNVNKSTLQGPKGSLNDLKAVESLIGFTMVDVEDKEAMNRLFPRQSDLLKKLEEDGFPPEKISDMCSEEKGKEKTVAETLFGYGLEFESLKKAGVTPSSIIGMKYSYQYKMYLQKSSTFHGEVSSYDLIPEFGFTVEELVKDGISKKHIHR